MKPFSCSADADFVVRTRTRTRTRASARQRRGRTGRGASLRRSALRTDSPAMLGLVARRRTRCVRCALYAQTTATSQSTKRAARAATSPALLGASEARPVLSTRAFAGPVVPHTGEPARAWSVGESRCCQSGRRYPPGAISGATSSAAAGSARASALRKLTRRSCLNEVSAANVVSSAARPRCEQRSAVGAQRRPPQHEPMAGTACRDALPVAGETAPADSKPASNAQACFMRRGSRETRWSH
jgi:hypothetical protein